MDYQALASLLFPQVTESPESLEERFPVRELPEGAVVTRMAPSPPALYIWAIWCRV